MVIPSLVNRFDPWILLLVSLSLASAQTSQFISKADLSFATPLNNTIFPVTCTGNVSSMVCQPVSFVILTNPSTTAGLVIEPISSIFLSDNSRACAEPPNKFDQQCGIDTMFKSSRTQTSDQSQWGIAPDKTGTCLPQTCDFSCTGATCQGCACATVVSGSSCTCFNTTRLTVRPVTFRNFVDARICFLATSRGSGAVERRCVYFAMLLPIQVLSVTVGSSLTPIASTTAAVGTPLLLTVRARAVNPYENLAIEVKAQQGQMPSQTWVPQNVELPNQRWVGPSVCTANGRAAVTIAQGCPDGWWSRVLTYTPKDSEVGMQYSIGFQVTRSVLAAAAFAGQSSYAYADPQLANGTACGAAYGLCPAAQGAAADLSAVTVAVAQSAPRFVTGVSAASNATMSPFAPGTPAAGAVLPAYVNCPMPAFGVYALQARPNARVALALVPSVPDAVGWGLEVSSSVGKPEYSTLTPSDGYLSPLLQGQTWVYVVVNWIPPPAAAGRTYPVCFQASDAFSSSTHCLNIKVVACMYCLSSGDAGQDTLHSVAARFHTNWLQVWSANDADLAGTMKGWTATRNAKDAAVTPWTTTGYPDEVTVDSLIRLGPVYRTRQAVLLSMLASRFKTTVESLIEVNPNLADGVAGQPQPDLGSIQVPAGADVCVIPNICTPAPPDAAADPAMP